MTSSRVIPGSDVGEGVVAWEAPRVEAPPARAGMDPAAELEALRRQAREQGYAEGHRSGLEAARRETESRVHALESVLNALGRPFEELDHRVEDECVALVQAIAQQLVRRELRAEPGEIVGLVRAGLEALPVNAQQVSVRLHPDDARLVRELMKPGDEATPWRIEADPVLERGSCQVVTSTSQVDARLETRLGRVIAGLLEDPRGRE